MCVSVRPNRQKIWLLFWAVWLGAMVAMSAVSAVAQETVVVRGGIHPNYARIVFDWDKPVEVETVETPGTVELRFAEEFVAEFSPTLALIGDYVASAEQAADGRAVFFPLQQEVVVRNFRVGNKVVVDLYQAADADEADESAQLKINVRAGEHPDYLRIVFDWPTPVAFDTRISDEKLTVSFDEPFSANFAQVEDRLSDYVGRPFLDEAGKTVSVPLKAEFGLRELQIDNRIVVDLLKDEQAPRPDSELTLAETTEEVPPSARETEEIALPEQDAVDPEDAAGKNEVAPQQASADGEGEAQPANATREAVADLLADVTAIQPAAPEKQQIELRMRQIPEGVRISVPFTTKSAAAVFMRGNTLWAVFDAQVDVDMSIMSLVRGNLITQGKQIAHDAATVLVFDVAAGTMVNVGRQQSVWQVDLVRNYVTPAGLLRVMREPNAEPNGHVLIKALSPKGPFAVRDPEAGDTILVSPVSEVSHAVVTPRRYVDFEILATSQGAAIIPFSDQLAVQSRPGAITISTPLGLSMSNFVSREIGKAASESDSYSSPVFMDFASWQQGSSANFRTVRRQITAGIQESEGEKRSAQRLTMARYYLSHGFAAEARAMLQLMVAEDSNADKDLYHRGLMGVAEYYMGRYSDAGEKLAHSGLRDDPHASLWRGAIFAQQQRWQKALKNFDRGYGVIGKYDGDTAAELYLLMAEAAINRREFDRAGREMENVLPSELPVALESKLWLLRGLVAEGLGNSDDAIAAYNMAESRHYRPTEVPARLARLELLGRLGSLSPEETTDGLEKLRYAWRGDDIELRVLQALGERYVDVKKYRNGLTIMRSAVTNFPDALRSKQIAMRMGEVFSGLYLDGDADDLPPVKALALYYDFRELTPVGKNGDEMIRRLGQRLVAVDLLAEAGELLDHQVRYRLAGTAKAQVAAQLAVIQLLDQQPEAALETIRRTRQTRLPRDLNVTRLLLEARALTEMEEFQTALDLIDGIETPEAQLLRADIHWESDNWNAAAGAMETVLGDRWRIPANLTVIEQGQVMRASIAYALAGQQRALDALKGRYGPKMTIGRYAEAFDVLTRSPDASGVAFRQLASTIAGIDTLQDFLANYRSDTKAADVNS